MRLRQTLTIVSGDLTAGGRRDEFEAARAWLSRLPQPQIATPGNHDVPYFSLSGRLLSPFRLYRDYVGARQDGGLSSRLDRSRHQHGAWGSAADLTGRKGRSASAAVKAAADEMRVATKALKVLVCHHPLIETKAAAVTGGVYRGAAAAAHPRARRASISF